MSEDVSLHISEFLNFLTDANNDYGYNYEQVNTLDKLTQDYLHDLELEHTTYKERAKLATQLRDTRRARRTHKDTVQVLTPVVDWINQNKNSINSLKQLLGSVRKEESKLQNRVYIRKVDQSVTKESTKADA